MREDKINDDMAKNGIIIPKEPMRQEEIMWESMGGLKSKLESSPT